MKTTLTKVIDLKFGDWVDLEHDFYADPNNNDDRWHFEYAIVDHIEMETSNCVVLHTKDGEEIGFPVNHEVKVKK